MQEGKRKILRFFCVLRRKKAGGLHFKVLLAGKSRNFCHPALHGVRIVGGVTVEVVIRVPFAADFPLDQVELLLGVGNPQLIHADGAVGRKIDGALQADPAGIPVHHTVDGPQRPAGIVGGKQADIPLVRQAPLRWRDDSMKNLSASAWDT